MENCFSVFKTEKAIKALIINKTEPSKNGAPEKCTLAPGLVNQANKLVMTKGPIMEVRLTMLVSAP